MEVATSRLGGSDRPKSAARRGSRNCGAKSAGECAKVGGHAEIWRLNTHFRHFHRRRAMVWKLELACQLSGSRSASLVRFSRRWISTMSDWISGLPIGLCVTFNARLPRFRSRRSRTRRCKCDKRTHRFRSRTIGFVRSRPCSGFWPHGCPDSEGMAHDSRHHVYFEIQLDPGPNTTISEVALAH